jgi:CMP-N-acetylneuraminic acid synthetase
MTLCGKPLIAYTLEAAQKAKSLDRVIVSTDSKEIAKVAEKWEIEVLMRPAELATATSPIDDSLRHVVSHLGETEGYQTDIVVLMQANLPIRADGVIDKVVETMFKTGADSVATAYEVNQRPEWMKRLISNRAVPYMEPSSSYRAQDLETLYLIDGAAAAIVTKTLMETRGNKTVHAYLGNDVRLVIQDRIYSVEIDDESDLKIAESLLLGVRPQVSSVSSENYLSN